ncbi:MAG: nicotinate-nucleotide adenylyltransferase [Nitrospirota bacterium]
MWEWTNQGIGIGGRLGQRIGILGGTFNPIHYGHLAAGEEIANRLRLDKVLCIPSSLPPHKQEQDMPSAAQRLEMVRLGTAGSPHLEPSDLEITRGGRSFTIDTIKALHHRYPESELFFIIGLDSFLDIKTWKCWKELLRECTFVVISRPGYCFEDLAIIDFLHKNQEELRRLDQGIQAQAVVQSEEFIIYFETIPLYDISSTDIRNKVKQRVSIKYLLPEAVETYIIKNRIYG